MVGDFGERFRSKLHSKMVYYLTNKTMIQKIIHKLLTEGIEAYFEDLIGQEFTEERGLRVVNHNLVVPLYLMSKDFDDEVGDCFLPELYYRLDLCSMRWFWLSNNLYQPELLERFKSHDIAYYYHEEHGFFICMPEDKMGPEEFAQLLGLELC